MRRIGTKLLVWEAPVLATQSSDALGPIAPSVAHLVEYVYGVDYDRWNQSRTGRFSLANTFHYPDGPRVLLVAQYEPGMVLKFHETPFEYDDGEDEPSPTDRPRHSKESEDFDPVAPITDPILLAAAQEHWASSSAPEMPIETKQVTLVDDFADDELEQEDTDDETRIDLAVPFTVEVSDKIKLADDMHIDVAAEMTTPPPPALSVVVPIAATRAPVLPPVPSGHDELEERARKREQTLNVLGDDGAADFKERQRIEKSGDVMKGNDEQQAE